jgi:anti-sigma B factor antagonist
MTENKLITLVRQASPRVNVIDIQGEISSFSEQTLTEAYNQAVKDNVRTVIFNFTEMTYMNSFGIGMLIVLLVRAKREGKNVAGYGLNAHFKKIFELTRLDQVIPIYSNEEIALASAEPHDLPEREY